jgi:hypothetical protein
VPVGADGKGNGEEAPAPVKILRSFPSEVEGRNEFGTRTFPLGAPLGIKLSKAEIRSYAGQRCRVANSGIDVAASTRSPGAMLRSVDETGDKKNLQESRGLSFGQVAGFSKGGEGGTECPKGEGGGTAFFRAAVWSPRTTPQGGTGRH